MDSFWAFLKLDHFLQITTHDSSFMGCQNPPMDGSLVQTEPNYATLAFCFFIECLFQCLINSCLSKSLTASMNSKLCGLQDGFQEDASFGTSKERYTLHNCNGHKHETQESCSEYMLNVISSLLHVLLAQNKVQI